MALPSTYKKKLYIDKKRVSVEYPYGNSDSGEGAGRMESAAAENMKDMIVDRDTYLPRGVLPIDMDGGFKDFVVNQLDLTLGGEKVPVFMMGIQKWAEFSQTWAFSDEYANVKIPFINVVRHPETKQGTNPNFFNIPQGKTFTYAEVPTWDGNRKGLDIYKIPQPIPVDITYDVRFFAFRQQDLNDFNVVVLKKFQSQQAYSMVNGHYIPILLDSIADDSNIKTLDNKRFYVQLYTFILQGFILDPEDFEVTPAINRTFLLTETK